MRHGPVSKEQNDQDEFGTLLERLRKRVMQKQILAYLPGWTKQSFSRLERGAYAPAFDQLRPIYCALLQAGVTITLDEQQDFVRLARQKLENKKTHRDLHSDEEWAELCYDLTCLDQQYGSEETRLASMKHRSPILLVETAHLVGRESWREEIRRMLGEANRKKIIVVSGPSGMGKTSELNWLAARLLLQNLHRPVLCDFRAIERLAGPEEALDVFLSTLLTDLGMPAPYMPPPSLDERMTVLLEQIGEKRLPVVILVDHAEVILRERGTLAPCWERFLLRFLRQQHRATLILATNQWPGWYAGELTYIAEVSLPPLSQEHSVQILQRLGLAQLPQPLLQRLSERVQGIPLCLEWLAALLKLPLLAQDWEEFEQTGAQMLISPEQMHIQMTQAVERLLAEPYMFAGMMTDDVAPILERIILNQRLTIEARTLLQIVSLATVPLARHALEVLCPNGPRPIKELQRANVLVAFPDRVQALPTIASAVIRSLSLEERYEREEQLLEAYIAWMRKGIYYEREKGPMVADLITLLITHHRLLDAAQVLTRHGWLAFHIGHAPRLAQLAEQVMRGFDWQATPTLECGGLLLYYILARHAGQSIDSAQRHSDYRRIYDLILTETVTLKFGKGINIVHRLMADAMNEERFDDAQALLDACCTRFAADIPLNQGLEALLQKKRAWLLRKWSDWQEEKGSLQDARLLRRQAITAYEQCLRLLSPYEEHRATPLDVSSRKKLLADVYNDLGYLFKRSGDFESALFHTNESLKLEEQGYVSIAGLANSYGEKSQILMEMGRFREALHFDEKAIAVICHFADTGHIPSQEEIWIYHVNRGLLYLRLGRIEESEQVLREAIPHIHKRRSIYKMFAHNALEEIRHWRLTAPTTHHQLDWRWVERFRQLIAYDAFWWWAQAGPFTNEEQCQWNEMYTPHINENVKTSLGKLIAQSRQREVSQAIAEQREPQICYPALNVDDIRVRLASLVQLDTEIEQHEPHPIVRHLYHGAIEYESTYLKMLVATSEKNTEDFWKFSNDLDPLPTSEEMEYPLLQVRQTILKGLLRPETAEISQDLIDFMHKRLQLSLDLSYTEQKQQEFLQVISPSSTSPQPLISATAVKSFFEIVLHESGYDGWQVLLDPKAGARVESAARCIYLPDRKMTLSKVRHLLIHELVGHTARSIAGEQSLLGLLAIGTKNHMPTEEGFALYTEHYAAKLHGEEPGELPWKGMLAVGLAGGVITPPQTFSSLCTFFELLFLLRNLLDNPQKEKETAQKQARKTAITRCLRTYLGVPNLGQVGICNTQDAVYLRGLRLVEQAVAMDSSIFERLGVGKIALEQLDDIDELGLPLSNQPLLKLAFHPELNAFIQSFEENKQ